MPPSGWRGDPKRVHAFARKHGRQGGRIRPVCETEGCFVVPFPFQRHCPEHQAQRRRRLCLLAVVFVLVAWFGPRMVELVRW